MSRADRPFLSLRRVRGKYLVGVHALHSDRAAARLARIPPVAAMGADMRADLGSDPRIARRRLRAILRAWGWPGRDVRDACAWFKCDRVVYPAWPRRTGGAR